MRARNLALLLTAALVVYLVLLTGRGVALLRAGGMAATLLGIGVLLLPLVGVWVVGMTWQSAARVQRLARRLRADGELPDVSDLPRRPSGRIDRAAADSWFADAEAQLRADPGDWRRWYRLAYAYDIAGDRRRARETMRKAIELEAADHSPHPPAT